VSDAQKRAVVFFGQKKKTAKKSGAARAAESLSPWCLPRRHSYCLFLSTKKPGAALRAH
jgi:hypothetical protein